MKHRYKYDRNLRLSFVSYEDRLATYIKNPGQGHLMIQETDCLMVASFNNGFCTDAMSFGFNESSKAWNFFEKLRTEPISKERTADDVDWNELVGIKSAECVKVKNNKDRMKEFEELLGKPSREPLRETWEKYAL